MVAPEQFIHEKNGILIDKDDPIQLKNAFDNMMAHHRDYNKASIGAEFATRFSAENIGRLFVDIYQQVLDEGK